MSVTRVRERERGWGVSYVILLHEKFLKFDWFREGGE